jgi:hypothetical protein
MHAHHHQGDPDGYHHEPRKLRLAHSERFSDANVP